MREGFKVLQVARKQHKLLNSLKNWGACEKGGPLELFLTSSSDVGVERNLGRNGSRFAPQAILHNYLGLINHANVQVVIEEVADYQLEKKDFEQGIDYSVTKMTESLQRYFTFSGDKKRCIHMGGGHDHIFCLLKGLEKAGKKKILIINIDPHTDTRVGDWAHSGNPFMRFFKDNKVSKLVQLGVDKSCNDRETLLALDYQQMRVVDFLRLSFWSEEQELNKIFTTDELYGDWDAVVLSLDCDAVEASMMEGVSSVSFNGLSASLVRGLLLSLQDQFLERMPLVLGFYKYNPLYDNISQKGARYLSGVLSSLSYTNMA